MFHLAISFTFSESRKSARGCPSVPGRAGYKALKEVPMEERFETIEIKVAFLEKSLEELDDVVRGLSQELDKSHKEIKWLREKVLSGEGEGLAPVERA